MTEFLSILLCSLVWLGLVGSALQPLNFACTERRRSGWCLSAEPCPSLPEKRHSETREVMSVCRYMQQPFVWAKQSARGLADWSDDTTNSTELSTVEIPEKSCFLMSEGKKPGKGMEASDAHVHVHSPTEPHFSGWSVAMEMTPTLPCWPLHSHVWAILGCCEAEMY